MNSATDILIHVHFSKKQVRIFPHIFKVRSLFAVLFSSRETWKTIICNHKCVLQKKWNSLDAFEGNSLAGFLARKGHPFICKQAVGEDFLNSLNYTVRLQRNYNANSWHETSSFWTHGQCGDHLNADTINLNVQNIFWCVVGVLTGGFFLHLLSWPQIKSCFSFLSASKYGKKVLCDYLNFL